MRRGSSIPSRFCTTKEAAASFRFHRAVQKKGCSSRGKKRAAIAILLCPRYPSQADCRVRALRVAAPCCPREAPFLAGLSEEDGVRRRRKSLRATDGSSLWVLELWIYLST